MTILEAFKLAVVHHQAGRLAEAEGIYRRILELDPGHGDALHLLGVLAHQVGRDDVAVELLQQAIALAPNVADFHNAIGEAFRASRQFDKAVKAYWRAIAIRPETPESHYNLGMALHEVGHLEESMAATRRALAMDPTMADAYINLGNALKDGGRVEEAIACYRQASDLKPQEAGAHSNLILTLNYVPGVDGRQIAEEQRRWNQQHAEPLRHFIQPHGNDRSIERRLRVGYVSPDFRGHSVAFFFESLLAGHDPAAVEVFLYADVVQADTLTAHLRSLAPHWREIHGLPDDHVAEVVRNDRIDILVDLAGHTAGHRLLVFARKPAPVQVTYLGYPGSTGLEAMDYRLTDAWADPPDGDADELHSECLIRLPECAWCFRPFYEAPAVSVRPMGPAGHVTFGCFNALPKINEPVLKRWSGILRAVPGSRLLLKNRSLQDASTQRDIRRVLESFGIAPDRVEMVGYAATLGEHLRLYGQVDIALDTFPYHGTTTTCEALWMGVPVVTLAGERHASRVGVSLLTNAGLPELIAWSGEEDVRIAAELAADLPRLRALRGALRTRLEQSPLMDARRFVRDVEAAYRQMWRQWCMGREG